MSNETYPRYDLIDAYANEIGDNNELRLALNSIIRSNLPSTVKVGPFCLIENAVSIGDNTTIGPYTHLMINTRVGVECYLEGCYLEGCTIGANTSIYRNTHIMGGATIGSGCLIGHSCFIASGSKIGNNVRMMLNAGIGRSTVIGNDVYIGPNVVFSNSREDGVIKSVYVGAGAWIGTNAVTTDGVNIGKGAIVGAGSVVTKSVPDYAVVVGNPAKFIRWNK